MSYYMTIEGGAVAVVSSKVLPERITDRVSIVL